jgi:hypothetical protein
LLDTNDEEFPVKVPLRTCSEEYADPTTVRTPTRARDSIKFFII